MMVYIIDEDGYYIEDMIIDDNDLLPSNCVLLQAPQGFYKPKWTGSEWVEGAAQHEIDEIINPKQTIPTVEDRIIELENTLLALLEVL